MNRIVQRNGAAPPWVELQAGKSRFIPVFVYRLSNTISVEMESAITSFRQILRQAWSRRTILILTTATPPLPLERLTVDYIANLRDPEDCGPNIRRHTGIYRELRSRPTTILEEKDWISKVGRTQRSRAEATLSVQRKRSRVSVSGLYITLSATTEVTCRRSGNGNSPGTGSRPVPGILRSTSGSTSHHPPLDPGVDPRT